MNVAISVGNVRGNVVNNVGKDLPASSERIISELTMLDLDFAGEIRILCHDLGLMDLYAFTVIRPLHPSPLRSLRGHFFLHLALGLGSVRFDEFISRPAMASGVGGYILMADALAGKTLTVKLCDLAKR
jgi:hypothetical protein